MKKGVIYTLVLFVIFLFIGCRSRDVTIIKFKPYKEKDYITKELNVYEVDKLWYPILDSIITKAEECSEYQELKDKIAFSFGVYGEMMSYSEELEGYAKLASPEVYISVLYPKFYNLDRSVGVFYYQGYNYYITNLYDDTYFKKTSEVVIVRYIDPEKWQSAIHDRGDRDMYWWYGYKNESLVNIQYGRCPTLNP